MWIFTNIDAFVCGFPERSFGQNRNENIFLSQDKLASMKEYIGYPDEILENWRLEELYQTLNVENNTYFANGVNMSIWGTNYAWGKLR